MKEVNNRKVLISVKVSTLLLIFTLIIGIVVATIIVKNKILKGNIKQINTAKIEENLSDEISQESEQLENEEKVQIPEERKIQAITSRSLEVPRTSEQEELHSIVVEEVQEETEPEIVEEPEIITTPISEVTISKDMDLTVRTGLSREDFITLMAGVKQDTSNFFEENAGLIYDVCEKYQLNEIFFCGLISAESGWTIAQNHRSTYNYISLMSNSGLIKFASVEDGMEKAAQSLHNNYLTPGGRFYYGSTLAGMKTKFCPASSTWVNLVYQRMQQIMNNR